MDQIPVYLLLSLPRVGAYAMFAVGIVVMYRASRVLNLAHGAMAMVPAYVTYSLWTAGVPMLFATVGGVASGALLGLAVDRVFIARLRHAGTTAQTVGTVAVLSLLIGLAAKFWGTTPLQAPGVFPDVRFRVGFSFVRLGQIGLFVTAAVVAAALFAFFRSTDVGLGMRGAAENRRAAALMGVDPDRMSGLAMMIGGGLAGLAGIMLAGVTNLEPFTLSLAVLPAFVAALIGGLESLPGALVGAAVVGVVEGMVPAFSLVPGLSGFAGQVGAPEVVLTIVALIVMRARGERFAAADATPAPLAAVSSRARRTLRPRTRRTLLAAALAALAAPWFGVVPFSILGDVNLAAFYVIVTVSIVLLTGWVGQISLAHGTFVGIAAFVVGLAVRGIGIPFPVNVVVGAGVAAAAALVIGVVALRVRGLYLAVATLIFAWMADAYLFNQAWLVGAGGSSTIDPPTVGPRDGMPFFDFSDRRTFLYAAVAAAVLSVAAAANVRDSKSGRAFFAIQGSEIAAASLGIDVTRYKLIAFGMSGALAGVAGTVLMVDQRTVVPAQFAFTFSLFYLSLAVVGGLHSLGGAVAASVLFAGLHEAFFRVEALKGWLDIVSAGLLAFVLLAYRGGLAAVPDGVERLVARLRGRSPTDAPGPEPRVPEPGGAPSARAARPALRDRASRPCLLRAREITVRFGGLVAASEVSLEVREGEIVGLIGPNGAGKTTVFNAISGLVAPDEGHVELFGRDAGPLAVHERARLGLGRTFQVIQLFRALTVTENLLVATHVHDDSGLPSHLLLTERAVRSERDARRRVREVVSLLDLDEVADRPAAGLPFGVLRMVELARALVSGSTLLMLDETASGLDSAETARLADLLLRVRDEAGVSMLLIEHDVGMVTAVSDHVYVLERGRVLADGPPEEVTRDAAVVSAYLGTGDVEPADTRA